MKFKLIDPDNIRMEFTDEEVKLLKERPYFELKVQTFHELMSTWGSIMFDPNLRPKKDK